MMVRTDRGQPRARSARHHAPRIRDRIHFLGVRWLRSKPRSRFRTEPRRLADRASSLAKHDRPRARTQRIVDASWIAVNAIEPVRRCTRSRQRTTWATHTGVEPGDRPRVLERRARRTIAERLLPARMPKQSCEHASLLRPLPLSKACCALSNGRSER